MTQPPSGAEAASPWCLSLAEGGVEEGKEGSLNSFLSLLDPCQ